MGDYRLVLVDFRLVSSDLMFQKKKKKRIYFHIFIVSYGGGW